MDDLTRRGALKLTAGATAAALGASPLPLPSAPQDDRPKKTDRECVIEAGMTEAEADCWEIAAKLAGAFFALPELHPSDNGEVASAIHIIQNKLLSRPTYRKYVDLARKARAT